MVIKCWTHTFDFYIKRVAEAIEVRSISVYRKYLSLCIFSVSDELENIGKEVILADRGVVPSFACRN
jgi:hypothetical protein